MRSLRWLLLIVIALVAAGIFRIYRVTRQAGKAAERPVPPMMSLGDKSQAVDWEWGQSADGKPAIHISARKMTQAADSKTEQLEGIELRIYQKSGKFFDRVRTEHAQFTNQENKLYAPDEAEITLDVPVDGKPKHSLTTIKAAGINYNSQTGQALTDQHVTFSFASGGGTCDGAEYDPVTHQIHLLHNVSLDLKSQDGKGRPMKVESEELVYNESAATIQLGPWARLTKDQTTMAAGATTVHLKNRKLDSIEAPAVKGIDKQQGRNLEYSADLVRANYNEHGEIEKMEGDGNARLVSHGKTSDTTMTGAKLNLLFAAGAHDSTLSSAQARGNAFVESKPAPDPAGLTPDTKSVRSEAVDVFMKPDGKELDRVSTLLPGTVEFIPNQPARSRRLVRSDRMLMRYGVKNELQSFHADAASTETHPSQKEVAENTEKKRPASPVATTSSKTLDASFDEKGQLKQILQSGNFRYVAGVRKAQADTATLDNAKNVMDLDSHARVSDDTGSTAANHIQINQVTDEFDATGKVETTRLPDQKPEPAKTAQTKPNDPGGMLDPGEAMQGKADHVVSSERGSVVHYIANAMVWQGASKIQADKIDINRKDKSLTADGHVISFLQDSPKATADKRTTPTQPVTILRSEKLVYTDTNRLALYTGGVSLTRSALTVKSSTMQAWLNDGKPVNGKTPESRIDRAVADGKVEIVQAAVGRPRIGTGEHGEYYTEEGRIVLSGGRPYLKDSLKGDSEGERLIYFTNDDRLDVFGGPKKPVTGHIIRGKS